MDMCRNLIALIFVVLASLPVQAGDSSILGSWIFSKKTKGGIGTVMTFTDGGNVYCTIGTLLEFHYASNKDTLTLTPFKPGGPLVKYSYILGNSELELTDLGNRQKTVLRRVEGASEQSLFGTWTYKHDTGGDAFMDFTESKRCYFTIPMSQDRGTYIAHDDVVTLKIEGKPEAKYSYRIEGDRLSMASNGDNEQIFFRKQ